MFPRRPVGRSARALVVGLVVGLVVAACGSSSASFDPSGPCTADGRVAGAYPALEALVPKTLAGKAPTSLDSGRNCTTKELGTLANHGVREVRFAGGLWTDSSQSGIRLAVFQAPGLQADWMGEWYEATARAGRTTGQIQTSKITVAGRPANRMDLVNDDSVQVVVTWQAAGVASTGGDVVNVVIAADEPESRVQEAFAAFP